MGWMPFQPPHTPTHGGVAEGSPHVSAVPQQNVLVVAAEAGDQIVQLREDLPEKGGCEVRTCPWPPRALCARCCARCTPPSSAFNRKKTFVTNHTGAAQQNTLRL